MTKITLNEAYIRETAYFFWLEDGQPEGCDQEHWRRAVYALSALSAKVKRTRKAAKPKARAKAVSK